MTRPSLTETLAEAREWGEKFRKEREHTDAPESVQQTVEELRRTVSIYSYLTSIMFRSHLYPEEVKFCGSVHHPRPRFSKDGVEM